MTATESDSILSTLTHRLESAHREGVLRVIHELGGEHSLEKILDVLDEADRDWVMSLKPIDLVRSNASHQGSNGATAPMTPAQFVATVAPPSPSPTRARAKAPPRPPKPEAGKKAGKKKAGKKAASKPAKKAARRPAKPSAKKAGKKAAKATSAKPEVSAPATSAAPKSGSQKAAVAAAVDTHVGKLAKGTRFKTGDVLAALGSGPKDTATRVKVVAALKALEGLGKIGHEGDGRASVYVVA